MSDPQTAREFQSTVGGFAALILCGIALVIKLVEAERKFEEGEITEKKLEDQEIAEKILAEQGGHWTVWRVSLLFIQAGFSGLVALATIGVLVNALGFGGVD